MDLLLLRHHGVQAEAKSSVGNDFSALKPKFQQRADGRAGRLLGERSFSTDSAVQLYPYLNTNVDIMSRFKHEEVFVSDAGGKDVDGVSFLRSLLRISTMGFYLRKALCLQSDCYVS